MYARAVNGIFRQLRGDVSIESLSQNRGFANESAQKDLALSRIEFAEAYVRDGAEIKSYLKPGRLVIVDLRDPYTEEDQALSLFMVLLSRFGEVEDPDVGNFNKLIVFDEAHKYMRNERLTGAIVDSGRLMRHSGVSIVVASQDPPSVPQKGHRVGDDHRDSSHDQPAVARTPAKGERGIRQSSDEYLHARAVASWRGVRVGARRGPGVPSSPENAYAAAIDTSWWGDTHCRRMTLAVKIWCEPGEHWWQREAAPGRLPGSCPRHAHQRRAASPRSTSSSRRSKCGARLANMVGVESGVQYELPRHARGTRRSIARTDSVQSGLKLAYPAERQPRSSGVSAGNISGGERFGEGVRPRIAVGTTPQRKHRPGLGTRQRAFCSTQAGQSGSS